MIPRSHFVNKIRGLGYTFKTKQKRTDLWRRPNGVHYISLPLQNLLSEEYVISTLRQAGCPEEEIRAFIAAAKA